MTAKYAIKHSDYHRTNEIYYKTSAKYEHWTKVPLNVAMTQFLAESYLELLPTTLLKAFDGGYFLIEGQEKYLDSHGELRKNRTTLATISRINLSICQIKDHYYYRIFVTHGQYHYWPHRITEKYTIQISDKEKVFTESIPAPSICNMAAYCQRNGYTHIGDRCIKKRPLTDNDKIIKEWSTVQTFLGPMMKTFSNHEAFINKVEPVITQIIISEST